MILPHILDWVGYRSLNLSHLLKGQQVHPEASWNQYYLDDPAEMKRITYPLSPQSLVVDLGGLRGEWSQRIFSRYCCVIDIYEPHPVLSKHAAMHFDNNDKVIVFPFGLSDCNGEMTLYGNDIYSSLYSNYGEQEHRVPIRKASEVFNRIYQEIDLLKINIEGAEYKVLPDLLKNFDMASIKNIQIQFHNTVPGHAELRGQIQEGLARTHTLEWCYDYLYESWKAIR